MKTLNFKKLAMLVMSGILALTLCIPMRVEAQTSGIDPTAMSILKRMTDHLGSLKRFSVRTQVTLEDVLESGHRIDLDVSANVIVERPNKLRAERKGELIDQIFFYNGKTLTLYNPHDKVYATEPAPKTIEGMLDYTRETLGLIVPAADLVYEEAYELLIKDVNLAVVLGKTTINGVRCYHLLFSRPGVDFQVWVSDGPKALPYKYVVTDTGNDGKISVSTVMSDWGYSSDQDDSIFTFVPTPDVKAIIFTPLNNTVGE